MACCSLSESAWGQVQADDIPKHEEWHCGKEPCDHICIVSLLVAEEGKGHKERQHRRYEVGQGRGCTCMGSIDRREFGHCMMDRNVFLRTSPVIVCGFCMVRSSVTSQSCLVQTLGVM